MVSFLEAYRRQECLWNVRTAEYSKSVSREKAYSEMVEELNLPGLSIADVKNKIKTVRTRYMAELNKIRISEKSGVDDIYEPRLFWFKHADLFLRSVSNPKPSSSNLKVST